MANERNGLSESGPFCEGLSQPRFDEEWKRHRLLCHPGRSVVADGAVIPPFPTIRRRPLFYAEMQSTCSKSGGGFSFGGPVE
jgi:hypothetical protein